MEHLKDASLALPSNIRISWRAFPRNKHSSLLGKCVNYSRKKFYQAFPACLMFVGMACSLPRVRPYPQTFDLAGEACLGTNPLPY
jgi:hypothetical protein